MLYGEQIDTYFTDLTGFQPRQFQQQAIAHLLQRQDVLLRAPTGSGKTETAIAPFLFAKALNLDFPNKLIYVVPLRTLANSLRQRTEALIQRWTEAHPLQRSIVVTLQTGENPEDPRFEGDIVFCTIDQLLSSFLSIPYSMEGQVYGVKEVFTLLLPGWVQPSNYQELQDYQAVLREHLMAIASLRRVWNFALAERKDWYNSRSCRIDACSLKSEYIIPADAPRPTFASQ